MDSDAYKCYDATIWRAERAYRIRLHHFSYQLHWTWSDSPSVAFSTTNLTVPGPPEQIALLNRTGGLLTVSITAPNDAGGAPVTGYLLYLSEQGGDYKVARRSPAGMVSNS
ncbi:Immunoglobulin-like fold [Phytophthora cactorum]|nr:Immunoglobulin-like fold [Phytophthora cactorum]